GMIRGVGPTSPPGPPPPALIAPRSNWTSFRSMAASNRLTVGPTLTTDPEQTPGPPVPPIIGWRPNRRYCRQIGPYPIQRRDCQPVRFMPDDALRQHWC